MRVTNKMISDQVISNLSRGITRFMDLQNQMSTGRRINKPSDDPIGAIKDLSYRSRLSQFEQYQTNILNAKSWLAHVDLAVSDISNLLIEARSRAVQLANGNYDATARESAANEVESIFDQIMQAGNTQLDNRYLFSGQMTTTAAFRSTSSGVVYQGDSGNISVEIETNTRMSINTIGSSLLTAPFKLLGDDFDLNAGIDESTPLADLNNGNGVDLSTGIIKVEDLNLGITVNVDISAAVTVGDVINAINTQLPASPPNDITNLTAELGLEGNNLRLVGTARPEVSVFTPLANLNDGLGVDMSPPMFTIHNADNSINITVDLSTASTLDDVINTINAELQAHPDPQVNNVVVSLNPASTGLQIQDNNAVPLGLIVSEYEQDNTTAADIGLSGNIGSLLIGEDLNPKPEFRIGENAPGETTVADLGLLGTFNLANVGDDLDPSLTLDTPLSLLNNGLGAVLDSLMIKQGDVSTQLDLGSMTLVTIQDLINAFNTSGISINASINSTGKGISIENTDPTKTLIIEDVEESKPAKFLGINGSPDVMGNLMVLMDALRKNDADSISAVIGGIDLGLDETLNHRASAGAKTIRLQTTEVRLTEYSLEFTKLLSEVEDADITQLVADLAQQENIYQAALQAAGKIIQPTLLDFLR